ncbi:DUF3970 family protein [Amycolatopsis sp. NBC_01480]|uniref:DUF3970 family protein n=1 Tax=Amycolatopsis sp. NBC_01480 TaxID=2903562 RepID=UPI002E297EDD|nr:DUF3970 family protein [Amycolatopsis sp. NBC_01480]
MTIKIRLDGEPEEITSAVQRLRETFEVAYNDKVMSNENSFTVRAYMEARMQPHAASEDAQGPV